MRVGGGAGGERDAERDISLPVHAKIISPGLAGRQRAGGLTGPKITQGERKVRLFPAYPSVRLPRAFAKLSLWGWGGGGGGGGSGP